MSIIVVIIIYVDININISFQAGEGQCGACSHGPNGIFELQVLLYLRNSGSSVSSVVQNSVVVIGDGCRVVVFGRQPGKESLDIFIIIAVGDMRAGSRRGDRVYGSGGMVERSREKWSFMSSLAMRASFARLRARGTESTATNRSSNSRRNARKADHHGRKRRMKAKAKRQQSAVTYIQTR